MLLLRLFFQRGHPCAKLPNVLFEQGNHSFYSLFLSFADFMSGQHYIACHYVIFAGLYDFAARLWLNSYWLRYKLVP